AAAIAFLRRLARGRFGGVPSAGSTTIRLVTNFLIPWRSKSIEVRSSSDSVMTPQPYWKCFTYWPSARAFIKPPPRIANQRDSDGPREKKREPTLGGLALAD